MRKSAFLTNWLSPKSKFASPQIRLEKPIRADLYPDDALIAMAKKVALEQNGALPNYTPFRLFSRLNNNAQTILHAYHTADANSRQNEIHSPATQWLVDNYYTIDKAVKQVRRGVSRRILRKLPTYPAAPTIPRIIAFSWFYIAHTNSNFSLKSLTATINSYQTITPLTIAELWLLPAALRFVLIENARRIATAIEHSSAMREAANKAADKIILHQKQAGSKGMELLLAQYNHYVQDVSFASHLLSRLENASIETTAAIKWLHYKRAQYDSIEVSQKEAVDITAPNTLDSEQNYQAANGVTMGNIIKAFKAIDDVDWTLWFESVCKVDILLQENSDFSALDMVSRNAYRSAVERIVKGSKLSELEITQKAIDLAKQEVQQDETTAATNAAIDCKNAIPVAQYLLGKRKSSLEKACQYRPSLKEHFGRFAEKLTIGAIALPVLLLTALVIVGVFCISLQAGMGSAMAIIFSCLAFFPAFETAFSLFNSMVSWYVPPRQLVGYAYQNGIPEEAKTLIVVPILINSRQTIDEQVRNLEVHYLSNPRGAVHFALLSDWNDAKWQETREDIALLDYARQEIAALNAKYGYLAPKDANNKEQSAALFYFLHRQRLENKHEDCYMGWERKRGKLHELNQLLRGNKNTSFLTPDRPLPTDVRYVMTLDSDTQLTPHCVAKLVGKMHHPLNRAKLDDKTQTVKEGYGLMQPRVTPALTEGADASRLQAVYSGERGLDAYAFAVSDTYQDILGEGTYTGKGLYDIDAFEASLQGRVPENSVLSHDLLEGGYARTAFVDDVEVVESYPTSFYVDTTRHHRWIRGDWQLLPYILGKIAINGITRWKMIDNLRRSLMAPALIAAFIGIWCLLPVKQAIIWQLILLAGLYLAPLLALIRRFSAFDRDYMLRGHFRAIGLQAKHIAMHLLLSVSFLAYNAWSACDAIMRTLYRLTISHKNLLEWQSSDSTKNNPKSGQLSAYIRMMLPAPILAILALTIVAFTAHSNLLVSLPILVLWFISPLIAWFVSKPENSIDQSDVGFEDKEELRQTARRNWAFYEAFVNAESNHLPPDNFQEEPEGILAHRTSPTNIGLYLLSTLSARDFGWISLENCIKRIEATLASYAKLEKYQGHIYNWYKTDTLEPLRPLYISTVDSGNLAGHFITLAAALKKFAKQDTSSLLATNCDGIADNLQIFLKARQAIKKSSSRKAAFTEISKQLASFEQNFTTLKSAKNDQIADILSRLTLLTDYMVRHAKALATSGEGEEKQAFFYQATLQLHEVCRAHQEDNQYYLNISQSAINGQELSHKLNQLAEQARGFAFAMQFGFLEHKDRRLLSIGYQVEENEIDNSCYDLLASEARLGVLFAIAKGDIKYEHWARLGRVLVAVGAKGALLSWSGSMFEYLMPPLVMHEPQGSILAQTAQLVVKRQIEYATELDLPWGISEAAFNARDPQMNYQYSAFGVPSLGLQRGLSRNRVIAPYATMLAAPYNCKAAIANLAKLQALGALGKYGYYDAVDFTPSRVPQGKTCAVIRNYYAHHHGMAILAITNVVHDNIMQKRFHSDPTIEAVELALQEKAPQEIPVMNAKALNPLRLDTDRVEQNSIRTIVHPIQQPTNTQLLAGGCYNIMLNAKGSGYSTWNGYAITRYQTDASEESQGSFLFLRDCSSQHWWSTTAEPTRLRDEETRTVFTAEKAEFYKTIDGIHSAVECLALPNIDGKTGGEGRRIKLFNLTDHEREIEIISYSELALNDPLAEAAHPVFSHMFVETESIDNRQAIFAHRRSRSENEAQIHAAHFVSASEGEILQFKTETNRENFIGRGRSLRRPHFFDPKQNLTNQEVAPKEEDKSTLDPIFSICCRVKIPAKKKVELVFWTLAADNREKLEKLIPHYHQADAFERDFNTVWTYSQIQRYRIGLTPQDISNYQKYATYLLYPEKKWQAPQFIANNLGSQRELWPMAISGDYPICVLSITNDTELPVFREILRAHEYWQLCGLKIDLVLLIEQNVSYIQDVERNAQWSAEAYRNRSRDSDGKEHIFILRKDQMSLASYNTLMAAAQISLQAGNGSLGEQLLHQESINKQIASHQPEKVASFGLLKTKHLNTEDTASHATAENILEQAASHLKYWNGYGGFSRYGHYIIYLKGGQFTPKPWINVISNAHFGMHVSAEGASFTWANNSRDYQLTPWSNDPVSNRPGEALYIVDRVSKKRFSPVAAVECDENSIYTAEHGFGSSQFCSKHQEIATELTHIVDKDQPLRLSRLKLTNEGKTSRSLRLYNYIEWVLGTNRAKTAPFLIPSFNKEHAAIMIANPYSIAHSEKVSFSAASIKPTSISSNRRAFLGQAGTVKHPEAIRNAAPLPDIVEAGQDTCSVMAYDVELMPNETKEIIFYVGSSANLAAAHELLNYAKLTDFESLLQQEQHDWQDFMSGLQVDTPDKSFNLLVNHWLPYQAYACRIKARAAFYQASGAFGLRDQLQDTLALLLLKPELAQKQILTAASRQFLQGDLQHWWLPETGAGVRTTISDDVVWLGYATAQYVKTTGDKTILDEEVPFISGAELEANQHDSFYTPEQTTETASLYQHCCLALDLALKRTGKHGLPLMLGGDWNDGMNGVGQNGRGESIWLGWFLGKTLQDFLPIARERGDEAHFKSWSQHLEKLKDALEIAGWDGAWYRRAYYDDGTPLGSALNTECQIDTIAQSWSIISNLAPKERQEQAFQAILTKLYDKEAGLIRLFWPPFDKTQHNPGYIKAYPQGVRENGGQYTHGAIWAIIAAAELGKTEIAYNLFASLNPINHGAKPDLYQVEPYVVAADIYSVDQKRGQGGWTWYTGSAGWMYRAATEAILGLKKRGNYLYLTPCLPQNWPEITIDWRHQDALYKIMICQTEQPQAVYLNDEEYIIEDGIPLENSGTHYIKLYYNRDA